VARRAEGDAALKLKVAAIGKDRSGLFAPAVQEYAKRLGHYTRFELIELSEVKGKTPDESRRKEAAALLSRKGPQDWVIALDERGKQLTSPELATFLQQAQLNARDVFCVIGGDEGLDASVRDQARLVLGLSRMTLPHRLARVVLVEQLYRAFTLIKGEPYHK
jgi:23S rRNA (pseudouridine1915-N3)-methyltransferase